MAQADLAAVISTAKKLKYALQYVYYGDEAVVDAVVATALAGGHIIILGPVGIGKTTLAKALAYSIGGTFKRVQATNETLPSDVLGYAVYTRDGGRHVVKGPIFSNVVLIDEINRMPPRSLSALIEAMQEGRVTIEGEEHPLPQPHVVIATANLQEVGLAQIPLAVLDRFTTSLYIEKPDPTLERAVVAEADEIDARLEALRQKPVATPAELVAAAAALRRVKLEDRVAGYIVDLVEATRKATGAQISVRAGIHIARLARAFAALDGRTYVVPDDVKRAFHYAMPHRIALKAENYKDSPLRDILEKTPAPW